MNEEEIPRYLLDRVSLLPNRNDIVNVMKKFLSTNDRNELIKIVDENWILEKKIVPKLNKIKPADILISTVGMRESPIVLSILILRVREVYLLHTKGSKTVASKVINDQVISSRKIRFNCVEIDEVDTTKIYENVKTILDSVNDPEKRVVIDPTSGRKAMSAGIASVAFYYDIPMKYLHGYERMGLIMPFSEEMRDIPNPYTYFGNMEIRLIHNAMNAHDFASAIKLQSSLKNKIQNSKIFRYLEKMKDLSNVYLQWDEFYHSQAKEKKELSVELNGILTHYSDDISMLSKKTLEQIKRNIEFLKKLEDNWESNNYNMSDKYRIIDLYQNAERLFEREYYTDALARLYRLLELIVFYIIVNTFREIGITLKCSYEITKKDIRALNNSNTIFKSLEIEDFKSNKLGVVDLMKILTLVEDYRDLAKRYLDNTQSDIRETRNKSLAGHGTKPVYKNDYLIFRRYINEWLSKIFKPKEKDSLIENSRFPIFQNV